MQYELIKKYPPNVYSPLEIVLMNRGIAQKDIFHYLHLTKSDNLSPHLLNNLREAASSLLQELSKSNFHIHLQVDCDCDGMTSAALFLNYIHAILPSAVDNISYSQHDGKIHGIDMSAIPPETTMIVVPDASSNEFEIHKRLYDAGIPVIVLDHHIADKVSEYAYVVNNQLCDYPNKALSGVGVVYKLCQYIDELLPEEDRHADDFLDLVAVGLVGDMMDLRSMETRYLVQEGLRRVRNPFIKGMAEKNSFQLKDGLTPIGVAFYIVPFINSMTRVGTQEEKKILFESMLEWKANELVPSTKRGCKGQEETIVEQALRTCTNVKNRQTREQDKAVGQVKQIIAENDLLQHKILLIQVDDPSFDRSITGLIANKIMAEYQHPVGLLVKTVHNGKPAWSGSARGVGNSAFDDFRKFCRDSELVYLAEGHQQAFGLGIYDSNIEQFLEYSDKALKDIEFSPSYKVDFIYNTGNLKPEDILELGDLKSLWGQSVSEPLIALEKVAVTSDMVTLMSRDKNPTLKINLPNGVSCIKFKSSEEEYNKFTSNRVILVNIVGRAEVNHYYDMTTPQILVTDYQIVPSRVHYYF